MVVYALASSIGFSADRGDDRVVKEVRHELVMLPYFNVYGNLAFKADGSTVALMGEVIAADSEIGRRSRRERHWGNRESRQQDRGPASLPTMNAFASPSTGPSTAGPACIATHCKRCPEFTLFIVNNGNVTLMF